MGAGALTICHNKAAVQIRIREDMKRMAQLPMLKNLPTLNTSGDKTGQRAFGVSLIELSDQGLVNDGVPSVLRGMVEYLRQHGLQQEGLFRVNASVRAVESLKQRLDSGEELDFEKEAEVCTAAGLLKQYLRELPEGLIHSSIHSKLIKLHYDCNEDDFSRNVQKLLLQLPPVHYSVLCYLCHFLTEVEQQQCHNRMTALNLATVFGPNVFHVSPGFEGIQEQNVCNKIMSKLIQNYRDIFTEPNGGETPPNYKPANIIVVKEAHMDTAHTEMLPCSSTTTVPAPVPRKKKAVQRSQGEETSSTRESKISPKTSVASPEKKAPQRCLEDENISQTELSHKIPVAAVRKKKATRSSIAESGTTYVEENVSPRETVLSSETPVATPRKKKVKKVADDVTLRSVPQPVPSTGLPFSRHLSRPAGQSRISGAETAREGRSIGSAADSTDLSPPALSPIKSMDTVCSSSEKERSVSPFYVRSHLSPGRYTPDLTHYLESTIRSAVEQHLFEAAPLAHMQPGQSLQMVSESGGQSPSPATTARQRRRQQRQQEENPDRCRSVTDKENIPSRGLNSIGTISTSEESGRRLAGPEELCRTRKPKPSPTFSQDSHNQDSHTHNGSSDLHDKHMASSVERTDNRDVQKTKELSRPKTPKMKIQEAISGSETSDSCEDVPRLDLSTLTEDSNWGEPVRAYSSWQRESMDSDEAYLSPHAGGKMIRQLLQEDSDPMPSPRFYAYGNSQQYLDDTEVPPSPPNTHSFISRRRSSSLGSCDNECEELSSTQLSKKVHNLKKKIRKFEERFEEERKYRPSHSDKAANPEVLRWMNELAKLRKDLKEHHLLKSEEDLAPLPRQRSNTLPKSFGSQLEKKSSEPKAPKPSVESTLESVMNKLKEKRTEACRPEDIKDMTREQIGAEKVALQKALLHYEGIHGRPITKTERQLMKPLYDRYRLVKQILCRASTIPVIGSPSSKRRGPQLQPIIEGEPALFFDHSKEEEDGSDEDNDNRTQFTQLTVHPELSMLEFLDHLDEEMDGFISPVDELPPSKNSTDMGLSNLHSATMQELVEQLHEAREEKKRIRKNLREFEDQFFRQNGRTVQKEDRSPLAVEYNEYKHIKAKLRLLEVLISKRDSSKFI